MWDSVYYVGLIMFLLQIQMSISLDIVVQYSHFSWWIYSFDKNEMSFTLHRGFTAQLKLWQFFEHHHNLYTFIRKEYNNNSHNQYSCSCQNTITITSFTGNTRLISKTCKVSMIPKIPWQHSEKHKEIWLIQCLKECHQSLRN